MNVVLFNTRNHKTYSFSLQNWWIFALPAIVVAIFCAGLIYFAYSFGTKNAPVAYLNKWQQKIDEQSAQLQSIRMQSLSELNALFNQLGKMQAHVARMDALGERLLTMANIDSTEFNFEESPAVGGPDMDDSFTQNNFDAIEKSIYELDQAIYSRGIELSVLEKVISNKNLKQEVYPAGKPVKNGWISSHYGWRTNPFGGNRQFHQGIDMPGKENTEIIAVGGGVVTWSGRRFGYGNMVEISHGNGYFTRYAHNKENLVSEGQTVKKGQNIALMGSTGRSTGPHVHFEVIKDGKRINPVKFLASREK